MAVFFGARSLAHVTGRQAAVRAMMDAFRAEAEGRTVLPTRLDVPTSTGFLRVMPAMLEDVMGFKVMTLVEGIGTRYLVLLYSVDSGELLALFDADELTRLRTAATTVLAAGRIVTIPPTRLGIIGSGFEAVGEFRALAALWNLEEAFVFSPTAENCKRFAAAMTDELGVRVQAVSSPEEALEGQQVVLLATKAREPVIDGGKLERGCIVLSIGGTRPDLRELDRGTLARAGSVIGDAPAQLESESGDIIDALSSGALTPERIVALSALLSGQAELERDVERDLLVFKSVGTALQDLAMAREIYRGAAQDGAIDLGELSRLKPFAVSAPETRWKT